MAIRVYKVADIIGKRAALSGQEQSRDTAQRILVGFKPAHDPLPDSSWEIELLIGKGIGERRVIISGSGWTRASLLRCQDRAGTFDPTVPARRFRSAYETSRRCASTRHPARV